MNEFRKLINKIAFEHELIVEQGPTPQLTQDSENNTNDQPIVDEPLENNNQPEQSTLPNQEDVDANQIEDSKELLYIRLIYKALITELDPSQYTDLIDIKEINNDNAKSVLRKLESIINSNTTIS